MRMTKKVKAEIVELLDEGLNYFYGKWEYTGSMEDEIKYDDMCQIVIYLHKKLKLDA